MMDATRLFEIVRFVIVGGINTINYYIVYLILLRLLHVHYLVSHIIGFTIALIISYFLNCYFVYKVKPTLKKFLAFPLTQFVNIGTQTLFIFLFVELLHLNATIAPFVGLIITIPATYLLSKYILKD
ncbi:GtrA family protein [Staphylococcus lutrae]|uniref:Polysaccharide biosynthesis protein n=1 Tax=Staphylococcus lutrae TaxID=155085 RepID=A0AAC9RU22_9STAP|nr:GtrA family protein [Staphylococcus lutrae]ARJ51686.1 polysaccharide biosynthesis protein [Staphylococcus lutrae]PNZ39044.1 GtrA family protein [Staphylococcus lutrae]